MLWVSMVTSLQFLVAYLIVDVLCIALTVIIAGTISRDSGSETQVRFFFLILTAFLVFVIGDAIWAIFSSDLVAANDVLMAIVNGVNVTAVAFAAYFWLCYTLAHFNSVITNSRRLRILAAIPVTIVPVLHIIGLFTRQNVIYLPDGTMTYGYMHTAITIIPLCYIVIATIIAIHHYRQATTRLDRRTSLTFMMFMAPFVIAGIVDMLVAGTPVVAACIMVSLVFVTMSMQEARISSDALTGLNNRRRADVFLEERLTHVSSDQPLALFIMDLNKFKEINDTYGHLEGDHALQVMANALRRACGKVNAFAARWGGDEFVAICSRMNNVDPESVCRTIKESLKEATLEAQLEYRLACTIGYAVCDSPDTSRSQLISQADKMLYAQKRMLKRR